MTERENALEVLNHTGRAQWLPIIGEGVKFCSVTPDRDRPKGGLDGCDWFGCYWIFDAEIGGYAQPQETQYPFIIGADALADWQTLVRFPDLDAADWETAAAADLADFDRAQQMLLIKTESGPFERLHQLYGFENAFLAMYDEPEAFLALMMALTEFRIAFFDKIITYYRPDLLMMMDDLGSSRGPLMSMEMYRRFVKPFDKKIADYIHSRGVRVLYHSCGQMQDFIPDILADYGADMIHPLQGGINDQERVQADYGGQIGFIGGLNNLVHLPTTTEKELRAEMRRTMDVFWEKRNLIVLPKSYCPGNSEILLDEAKKYNRILSQR